MLFSSSDTQPQTQENNNKKITPLGLFFSDNQPVENESRIHLKFSPDLFSDSLFLKQPETLYPVADELTQSHIYFPDAVTTQNDTISWSVTDRHSQSFDEYCKSHRESPDAGLIESLILKICTMVHHIHNNDAADYPISSDMIRFTEQGEPMMLLMPPIGTQPSALKFKSALFTSQVGAPEIQNQTCMNPQAFAYNVGMLAAQLLGYSPSPQLNAAQSLHALIQWLQQPSTDPNIARLQKIILQTLQDDPEKRPFCPMKIYKAITGQQPFDCEK
jgi:hypothetical protein